MSIRNVAAKLALPFKKSLFYSPFIKGGGGICSRKASALQMYQ